MKELVQIDIYENGVMLSFDNSSVTIRPDNEGYTIRFNIKSTDHKPKAVHQVDGDNVSTYIGLTENAAYALFIGLAEMFKKKLSSDESKEIELG